MADRIAKSHSNISQRARSRLSLERKPVFKSVLANPFAAQWPSLPQDLQSSILTQMLSLFVGVAAFHGLREEAHVRKRHLKRKLELEAKANKPLAELTTVGGLETPAALEASPSHAKNLGLLPALPLSPPSILRYIALGINEVSKRLENQARRTASTLVDVTADDLRQPPPIKYVFVCQEDVNPAALIRHIPQLVATCNSAPAQPDQSDAPYPPVKIVPLSRGAEATLATALGLRRVAVMAVADGLPGLVDVEPLLNRVPLLPTISMPGTYMEPTHIKQLRTTAPKDMKAAKELRAAGKAAAKGRKKLKRAGLQGSSGV
ncbi:hypothetical protein FA95DRAFT_1596938 [Auriscalpium vulgare]|uniref:Uncharacterized protein n=1 Tax=Auriscalpium vulgare TaxID=40419 RepID=A0ACB8RNJ9_9AGAM|nr:hypothetical protein FA95DRAFT_1596938 [Auriscalpium vulgare]